MTDTKTETRLHNYGQFRYAAGYQTENNLYFLGPNADWVSEPDQALIVGNSDLASYLAKYRNGGGTPVVVEMVNFLHRKTTEIGN